MPLTMARNMAKALRRCTGRDDVELSTSERVITAEGYLRAPGNISRTGIQEYTKLELGIDASHDIVRLYRPPAEVFSVEAMASADGAPMTFGHPDSDVTSKNWRIFATGDARDPVNADPFLQADLIFRDEYAVYAAADGVVQISCGYSFDFDPTPGVTPDGQSHDGVMRNIRINHIAQVYAARCGAGCSIADSAHRSAHDKAVGRKANDSERKRLGLRTGLTAYDSAPCACKAGKHDHNDTRAKDKPMRTITVDGVSIKLEDDTAASLVERVVGDAGKATKAATDARDASVTAKEAADKALTDEKAARAKDATDHATALADLQGKVLTDAQQEALAEERTSVVADAKVLAPELETKGKTRGAIRTEALTVVLGDSADNETLKAIVKGSLRGVALDKATPDQVAAAFDAAVGAARASGGGTARQDAADASARNEIGRALAGVDVGGGKPRPLTGADLLRYRQTHGGRAPGEEKRA